MNSWIFVYFTCWLWKWQQKFSQPFCACWNYFQTFAQWNICHLHSGRKRTCRTTMTLSLKWQGKLSILFEPCHHLRTYCSFLFLL